MTTLARQQAFVNKLQEGRAEQARQERLALQAELRAARTRRDALALELREEEEYCRGLERQMGAPEPRGLDGLPRDTLRLILAGLRPAQALALCMSCSGLHKLLHGGLVRALRRHYNLSEQARCDMREPLVQPVWVSFVLRPAVTKSICSSPPPPQQHHHHELYCLRCRKIGHEIPQCALACRKCGRRGHPESRCTGGR